MSNELLLCIIRRFKGIKKTQTKRSDAVLFKPAYIANALCHSSVMSFNQLNVIAAIVRMYPVVLRDRFQRHIVIKFVRAQFFNGIIKLSKARRSDMDSQVLRDPVHCITDVHVKTVKNDNKTDQISVFEISGFLLF